VILKAEARTTVTVIGLGYIGLPTAAILAHNGANVVGVDVNQSVVDTINAGNIHIHEPGLEQVVHDVVSQGRLSAATKPIPAQAHIIAVPTPLLGLNREADLSYIKSACEALAPVLRKGSLVVLESTSPPGTTVQMMEWLAVMRQDLSFPHQVGEDSDIRVAHCPERVLPGRILDELVTNDRVIGGVTPSCAQAASELYRLFVKGDCIVASDPATAEMSKLAENSFRDVNIAFANELSSLAAYAGVDIWELISIANLHPRVDILNPGPGVGGHCIAVDPWFLINACPDKSHLLRAARQVNDEKPNEVIARVLEALPSDGEYEKQTVACYGVAFKADVDDCRESPALAIAMALHELERFNVVVVDPFVKNEFGLKFVDLKEAILDADLHLLLVDHTVFKTSKPECGEVIDTRGIWC